MNNDKLDRFWSKEAEAAVLGSMIIDHDCIDRILPILTEDSFFSDENKLIYAALLKLHTNREPTDAIALRTELKNTDNLDKAGGVEYIAQILDSVPTSANAVYYARIVRDRQRYRNLINDVERILKVPNESLGVDEQIQKVQEIALGLKTDKPETEYCELAAEVENVAATISDKRKTIPTGFHNIDQLIQGITAGELVILAGRPSMGKSALALDMALNMAQAGKSVVYFTLEMSRRSLMERAISNVSKVSLQRLKDEPTTFELDKAKGAAAELKALDIVLHKGCPTPEKQIAFIRARKKFHEVDMVFVDYLQLMNAGHKAENRVQEISAISRKLKLAALQERIPIIALSQLSRKVEERKSTGHRPILSDLRDSGSIEQDADIVMLLYRADYYERSEPDGEAELNIAKNRRGPTGVIPLTFFDEIVRFGDLLRISGDTT